jgi:hypothetical protein
VREGTSDSKFGDGTTAVDDVTVMVNDWLERCIAP